MGKPRHKCWGNQSCKAVGAREKPARLDDFLWDKSRDIYLLNGYHSLRCIVVNRFSPSQQDAKSIVPAESTSTTLSDTRLLQPPANGRL